MIFNDLAIALEEYPSMAEFVAKSQEQWQAVAGVGQEVVVNVAAAEVWLLQDGELVRRMKAGVGRLNRPTPLFTDAIEYLEVNPRWYVPAGMAQRDLIPKFIADPDKFSGLGYRLYDDQWQRIPDSAIDWLQLQAEYEGVYLVQQPGWANAMGTVKFKAPNPMNVFLHDTPDRSIFGRSPESRTVSAGCVRVEDPQALVDFLLGGDQISLLEQRAVPEIVELGTPVPLHLLYMPVWVDEEGDPRFSPDLYGLWPGYQAPAESAMMEQLFW
ncbi:L,D-transpeptidase family protein [Ferrimonas marina]|uniref:L,D-transpeptidase catalytic domain n=1 Tax=Ferrimonas marina TaxID=299255 RepID=A0A1M5TAX5_9GAMM|nr:L,D-transpeptidase family protein [Ferrimonas marina]SHH47513.1 L,D-transpeptidase catalytic domain [Ferrimonas marina]